MKRNDRHEAAKPARIAVLGTLAEFHQDPLPYDLSALIDLVAGINPDLLCLDMSMSAWQQREFDHLPPEYREALLPLAAQTDIVVVPIGGEKTMPRATAGGWRGTFIDWLRSLLARIQAGAPGPDAINQGWRHHLGNVFYSLARRLAGPEINHAYHAHIEQIIGAALQAAGNNPGSRILVVTNIQYCHHIRPRLRGHSGTKVVSYQNV